MASSPRPLRSLRLSSKCFAVGPRKGPHPFVSRRFFPLNPPPPPSTHFFFSLLRATGRNLLAKKLKRKKGRGWNHPPRYHAHSNCVGGCYRCRRRATHSYFYSYALRACLQQLIGDITLMFAAQTFTSCHALGASVSSKEVC